MSFAKVFQLFQKNDAKPKTIKTQLPEVDRTPLAKSISSIIHSEGGWEPLGCDEDNNYLILSRKSGRVVCLGHQDLNEKKLRAVVGSTFCDQHYQVIDPETHEAVFDHKALAQDIVRRCDEIGLAKLTKVISTGLYREGDELIIHYGTSVRTASGTEFDTTPAKGTVYVAGPDMDVSVETAVASTEDIQSFLDVIATFALTPPCQRKLVGWWVASAYGPVVPQRPIAAVSAEAGSGKTTLLELLCTLHGEQAIRRDGIPTLAQALYAMEDRQRTLYCDEVEARAGNRKVFDDLAELARIGFTNSKEARLARVIGGKTRYFNAPAGVIVAGIGLPEFNRATESRAVRFRLDRRGESAVKMRHPLLDQANRDKVEQLGQRIRRLLHERWAVMRDSSVIFRMALEERGHDAREAEKYAALLAGYWTLTRDRLHAQDEVQALLIQTETDRVYARVTEAAYEQCLDILLSSKVVIYSEVAGPRSKAHIAVGQVIRSIITGPAADRMSLAVQLEDFGIRVDYKQGGWKLMVCTSASHQRLPLMYRGTDFALGGWKDALLRLPGASETVQRIGSQHRAQRAVMFDVPDSLQRPAPGPDYHFLDDADAA